MEAIRRLFNKRREEEPPGIQQVKGDGKEQKTELLSTLRQQVALHILIGNCHAAMADKADDEAKKQEGLDIAQKNYFEGLAAARAARGLSKDEDTDIEGEAAAWVNLGRIFLVRGQDRAEDHLQRGLALSKKINNKPLEEIALAHLAQLAKQREQTE